MTERVSSRQNPLIRHMARLARDAAARRETGEILCEGEKLLRDALDTGLAPIAVLCTEGQRLPPLPEAVRIVTVPAAVLESVSALRSPPGVLFTARRPEPAAGIDPGGRHVLLDRMQDPGNVGTLFRTAEAFSVDTVLLTAGGADPYGPKALRAAMGAALRQKAAFVEPDELPPLPLVALDAGGEDIRGWTPGPCIAVIGNEGGGIAPELLARCTRRLRVPMTGKAESLNAAAAAAVLMWEMMKP
ncbi:MAG: RNA methyltransferase [Oscillospiraceae bacterium]|nr:RNA methyltransferase [Oscillospiraceae bacterium]